jgi:hypothetical protein
VLGASREEGHPRCSTPLRSGRARVLCSQASAHVARHDVITGRSATRLNNAEPGGARWKSDGLRRRTQRSPAKAGASRPLARAGRTRESRRGLETRERVKRCMACPQGTLRTAAQIDVAFPGGSPKRHNRPTRTGRQSGAGKGTGLGRFVPARQFQVADFGIRTPSAFRARKQSGGLARGGQPGHGRKTRTGSCSERRGVPYRRKASRIVASRPVHAGRGKRSRSHGHHANRPAKAEA